MEEKSNFTPAQLAELQKYFRSIDGHFEIASGHQTIGHGRAEYCLTTDSQQGIHIYEQGNMKIGSNHSMELVTGFDADAEHGLFSIRCENGNIVIEAKNGNLILSGKNVLVHATAADGAVHIQSPRNIVFDAASVATKADNIEHTSAFAATTLAAYTMTYGHDACDIHEGPEQVLDGTLIQKIIGAIEQIKMFFKSICIG